MQSMKKNDEIAESLVNEIGVKNAIKLSKLYIKKYNTTDTKDFKMYHKWSAIYYKLKKLNYL